MKQLAAVTMTFAAALAGAQAPSSAARIEAGFRELAKGGYLAATRIFAAAAFGPNGKVSDEAAFQMWSQYSPMITGELPLDAFDRYEKPTLPIAAWKARVEAASARDALAEIVRRARATRIVVINEAHFSPRDRAFILEVARALRPLGYRYLAVETLDNETKLGQEAADQRLTRESFVRMGTGGYSRDPVFAAYLREAITLGYQAVAYEQTSAQEVEGDEIFAQIEAREAAQTANIMAKVLARDPEARLLIHVGNSHVSEAPLARGESMVSWLAARLKAASGIDPLTIDQTTLTDLDPGARAAYPVAASKAGPKAAILFAGTEPLVLGDYAGKVDLQVVHPARRYLYGRPAWRVAMGGKPVAIPPALLPRTGERLIQAFAADAPADAVPLDQVLVRAGAPAPRLILPAVRVRYATQP